VTLRHGHRRRGQISPTYSSWRAMINRCRYPYINRYENYGGRGIVVCDRWLVFDNFLADLGERPEGTSLDRIDPNGDYEPGNVRWSTASEQQTNRRPHINHQRKKTHCPQGHPYDEKNTRWSPRGSRYCRTCEAIRAHARVIVQGT